MFLFWIQILDVKHKHTCVWKDAVFAVVSTTENTESYQQRIVDKNLNMRIIVVY